MGSGKYPRENELRKVPLLIITFCSHVFSTYLNMVATVMRVLVVRIRATASLHVLNILRGH